MKQSFLDNQISYFERQVHQAKHVLMQQRDAMHGIINGRKLDPKDAEVKIRDALSHLEISRRELFKLYSQKFPSL